MPRRKLVGLLVLTLMMAVLVSPRFRALSTFPAQFRVQVGNQHELRLDVPLDLWARCDQEGVLGLNGTALGIGTRRVSLATPLVFEPISAGQARIEFRLFNLIPFKRVVVEVVPEVSLVPGGQSIGILLQPDGVLVVGLATVTDSAGVAHSPARKAGVEAGDVILRIAGEPVTTDEQIAACVDREGRAGHQIVLDIRRQGSERQVAVSPVLCRETGRYRLGLLVRDLTAGVGTLSFYEPDSLVYGALGHVISDAVSGQPVDVHSGRIVQAFVAQIQLGRRGEPGEKLGSFVEGRNVLGNIQRNSTYGIYGELNQPPPGGLYTRPMPMALARDVRVGPAEIVTVIEGDKLEKFAIEIKRVYSQSRPAPKGMIIQVTDPRLLAKTGGIVQGMSGSPIIQGGRIVGAVTHVFVNDPTRGYGMYAEWMVMEAGLVPGKLPALGDPPAGARAVSK